MHINKLLLLAALGQAMAHAENQKAEGPAPDDEAKPREPEQPIKWVKGTPPNPARMTKAQKKAAKRERRTKAAT